MTTFRRNGKFLATCTTTSRKNPAAISGAHPFAKSVFVAALGVRGLVSTFAHFCVFLIGSFP